VEGVAKVGETLTAKVTPEKATVTYKWMRADAEDGEYVAIAGATDKTYTLSEADAGKWIKVEVKGTGNYTGTKSKVVGPVEEVEEPIETIEATIDYNAVWNESRGTWYIKVTVPDENLDAGSVKSIHAITEAGVDLDEPRELTPDTDTVMWFGVAEADGEVTLKADGEYAYKVVRLDDSEYIFSFDYAANKVQGVEEVEEPIETIEATIDYNAVWNESRGTWYIKVTVPDENLDAGSVKSIHAITEAGVDLDEPRELTPDTDTVMWFGVAEADGEVTLKADGEYAYKVVRLDDSEYIFSFDYAANKVQGVEEVEEPIETIEATIDYNAVWNESRGTWYIKVTVPDENLDAGSVKSIHAITEAGVDLDEPRELTPDTDTVMWFGVAEADGEVTLKADGEYAYKVVRLDDSEYIFSFDYAANKVQGVEEVEEPIETIEATIDYNAVWNESRGTWYIKVTVPDENLDAGSVKSIHAITEAGVDLDEPRELTPDTDTVMWFGVAEADGEVTLKADGEYAYKVVRLDDSEYIFSFDYAANKVQGVEEVEEPIETIEATIDYNAVWNESRGTWYIKVTVPDENLDAGSVKSIHAITEAGVDLDEPRELTPDTDTVMWFGVAEADGEVTLKADGEYAYKVVRLDDSEYIFSFDYAANKVQGVEEVEEPIETIEATIDYNAVWNESRGTWYIKVTVPDENLDAGSVKSIHAITEAGVDLDEPRELTPDTDTVMWFGVAEADGEVTLKADGEYAYKVVRLDDSEYIFSFDYAANKVQGVEEVEEPIETIEATIDYNAVWNESRGTWYIKVTVPDENLDAGSVKSIHAITEAGVDLDEPRELTPDTDTVMWFGVAEADGEVTLKADGEYAYKVVRLDDSEYIFSFDYAANKVQGVEEVEEPIETIEATIDYNAVWNESRGTWYIKVTVPDENLDAGSVKSIHAITEAGVDLDEPRELTPDTDTVMWFGVAEADGEVTLKADGEYAYKVVRLDDSEYIFSFDYAANKELCRA
jgi:adenosine/AMP kinase